MAHHAAWSTADVSEKARRDLLLLLEGVRGPDGGKKNLVLEKSLAGPLNLLVKFSTLQEYGVDKVFFLENGNIDASRRNVVFLARGESTKTAYAIADQISKLREKSSIEHEFSIFWVPRRTRVSDMVLEELGILGEVSIFEYQLYFVPLADDLLSLELDDSFAELYMRKDPTCVYLAAKALMRFQQQHGLFPRIIGKGEHAKLLAEMLLRMRSELTATEDSSSTAALIGELTPSTVIDSLIVIDREVDFPTVLLTQLTYEGLIDEFYAIDANQVELSTSVVGAPASSSQQQQPSADSTSTPPPPQSLKRKILLDPSDTLYSTLRDANFATVGPLLNTVARRLQSTYESRHAAAASRSTSELRDFVAKLPGYQAEQASLKLHTSLAEQLISSTQSDFFTRALEAQQTLAAGADATAAGGALDILEELAARAAPLCTALRLLSLASCFSGGLRSKDLDYYRRIILLAYGSQHTLTLSALAKIGLVTGRAASSVAVSMGIGGLGASTSTASSSSLSASGNSGAGRDSTNYTAARRQLHLIVDDVDEASPGDVSYVFSGYAPLSVRLVQCLVQKSYMSRLGKPAAAAGGETPTAATATPHATTTTTTTTTGWKGFEDAVRQVRGPQFERVQSGGDVSAVKMRQMLNGHGGGESSSAGNHNNAVSTSSTAGGGAGAATERVVIVFFLGGVCRAEVAALRFLSRKLREEGAGRRIVVCTTSVVTGDSIIGAAVTKGSFER